MSLRINLGSRRVFWGTIAAAGILILLILSLWVVPAYSAARVARGDWDNQLTELKTLQADAANIPSMATLTERRAYRAFVEQQAEWVRSFFADRTKLMEAELAGQGNVDPTDFKNAYQLQIEQQRIELSRAKIVADPAKAYNIYPWVTTGALPDPAQYAAILHDYWTRYYLYRAFMGKSGGPPVSQVLRLEVRKDIPIDHAPEFEGVPFSAMVTLDPKSVIRLVSALLSASPTVTDRPVFQLTGLKLAPGPDPRSQLCALTLDGYVLLLKKNEKPAAPAAKTGGAEKK